MELLRGANVQTALTIVLTAFLLVLSTGCANRDRRDRPMIYRGGQSYDQALHAEDVSIR
jgi:hypothetical protein